MKKKTAIPADKLKQSADDLLCQIGEIDGTITHLLTEYEQAKQNIDEKYNEKIAPWERDREATVKGLTELMKKGKTTLFQAGDHVYLRYGSLIYSVSNPVAFPRSHDALIVVLEQQGFHDVVKVKKSLDKDAVEKWEEPQLKQVGLTRKRVEDFKYDLKKEPAP